MNHLRLTQCKILVEQLSLFVESLKLSHCAKIIVGDLNGPPNEESIQHLKLEGLLVDCYDPLWKDMKAQAYSFAIPFYYRVLDYILISKELNSSRILKVPPSVPKEGLLGKYFPSDHVILFSLTL